MEKQKLTWRAAEFSSDILIFTPFVLYVVDAPGRWPTGVMLTIACAGSAGIVAVWLARRRQGRVATARYVGVSGAGEAPGSIRARQRAIEAEARGRYGPEIARLGGRGSWRVMLGRGLFQLFGVGIYAGLAVPAAGGAAAILVGGACLVGVGGIVFMLMGAADGRLAAARARALSAGQDPMPGIGTPRSVYLHWCEQHGREPYPFERRQG